ncbi:MAG TPA: hypothetical protein PK082_10295, partial [Phycisphaerae bacterium]|nr:hypothetical protein [Phycisphaerae bacterium]
SVRAFAVSDGADLFGVANVERWACAPPRLTPQAHLPGARSVIVVAAHHPDASVEFAGIPTANYMGPFQIGQTSKLESLAHRIARFLKKCGYASLPYPATRFWWHRKHKELDSVHTASFSHRHAAVAAGLGEFGWNNLLLTPQYGPRQRVASVITTAPLEPTPLYDGPALCDRCNACERACPGDTFRKELLEPGYDIVRIEDREYRYAKLNRWRCLWGEQFRLPSEKLPARVDERVLLDACRTLERCGLEPGACLRACMAGPRRAPKAGRVVFRRKKDSLPLENADGRQLMDALVERGVRRGAAEVRAIPLQRLKDVPLCLPDGYPWQTIAEEFKSLILARIPRPRKIATLDDLPVVAEAERLIGFGLWTQGTNLCWELTALLDNLGYEAMCTWKDLRPMIRKALALLGWSEEDSVVAGGALTSAVLDDASPACPCDVSTKPAGIDPGELETLLRQEAVRQDLDLFGIAPADRLAEIDGCAALANRLSERGWKLLVLGQSFFKAAVEQAGKDPAGTVVPYAYNQYQLTRELMTGAAALCRLLARRGYLAYPIADFSGGSDRLASTRGELPSLHANAAVGVAAGLGELGRSGLLLTPRFGPRQRILGIVTDAPLATSPLYAGPPLCTQCGKCVSTCPTRALGAEESVRIGEKSYSVACRHGGRCAWSIRHGLVPEEGPGHMGWTPVRTVPVPENPTEADVQAARNLKDPLQVLGYQNATHTDTILESCMACCPAGTE